MGASFPSTPLRDQARPRCSAAATEGPRRRRPRCSERWRTGCLLVVADQPPTPVVARMRSSSRWCSMKGAELGPLPASQRAPQPPCPSRASGSCNLLTGCALPGPSNGSGASSDSGEILQFAHGLHQKRAQFWIRYILDKIHRVFKTVLNGCFYSWFLGNHLFDFRILQNSLSLVDHFI